MSWRRQTTITSSVRALELATVMHRSEVTCDPSPVDVWPRSEPHASTASAKTASGDRSRLPPAP